MTAVASEAPSSLFLFALLVTLLGALAFLSTIEWAPLSLSQLSHVNLHAEYLLDEYDATEPDARAAAPSNFTPEAACIAPIMAAPGAGVCNRLRFLAGMISLARATRRPLSILWRKDPACGAAFDDLFDPAWLAALNVSLGPQPPPHCSLEFFGKYGSKTAGWPSEVSQAAPFSLQPVCPVPPFSAALYVSSEASGAMRRALAAPLSAPLYFHGFRVFGICGRGLQDPLLALRPSAAVAALMAAAPWPPVGTRVVGVHLRRGDFRQRAGPLASFIALMDAEPPGTAFFLATENATDAQALAARYGRRLYAQPATLSGRVNGTSASRVRSEIIVAATADLLLLARCAMLIGTEGSSFTEIAARLGGLSISTARPCPSGWPCETREREADERWKKAGYGKPRKRGAKLGAWCADALSASEALAHQPGLQPCSLH